MRGFFFISFLGRFLGKTAEKFVNKQLARANWVKRVEEPQWSIRMTLVQHGNYRTIKLRVNNKSKLKVGIEKAALLHFRTAFFIDDSGAGFYAD